MLELQLPPFDKKIVEKGKKMQIFDDIRRKYVALTPEEWVRQHFVHYLIGEKECPQTLMNNEVTLTLNGMSRRCDTVVYDRTLQPLLIVEYKAPSVAITQKVFDQICRYNMVLQVRWLIVSNGLVHYCCRIDPATLSYSFVDHIPTYTEMTGE